MFKQMFTESTNTFSIKRGEWGLFMDSIGAELVFGTPSKAKIGKLVVATFDSKKLEISTELTEKEVRKLIQSQRGLKDVKVEILANKAKATKVKKISDIKKIFKA